MIFFRLNNSREEELAVGMKEVQATTIATKTATTKTITKKHNNHLDNYDDFQKQPQQ